MGSILVAFFVVAFCFTFSLGVGGTANLLILVGVFALIYGLRRLSQETARSHLDSVRDRKDQAERREREKDERRDYSGYCPSCGSPIEAGVNFCPVCGKKVR